MSTRLSREQWQELGHQVGWVAPNKCRNPTYNGIGCPYALSDDAPIPCIASQEQCDAFRSKREKQGIQAAMGLDALSRLDKLDYNDVIQQLSSSEMEDIMKFAEEGSHEDKKETDPNL